MSDSMSIEQEVVKQEQPNPKVIEQSPKENAGFSSRLVEVRENSRKVQQSVTARFEQVQSPKPADQLSVEEIAPETVFSKLEVLTKDESLTPSEFLSQSNLTLQASSQLRNQALSTLRKIREQQESLKNDNDNLSSRIKDLSRARGLRKIFSNRQKIRLTSQTTEIKDELAQLESQAEAEKLFSEQIQKQEKPIRQKQEDILITMIGEDVASIRNDYEKLFQEIIQDGSIASDIRETFIQEIIMPDIKLLVPDQARRDESFNALHKYIDHREDPNIRTSPYRQALDSFNSAASILAEPLINKDDESVVKNLVAKIAADDIRPIISTAEHQLSTYDWRNKLDTVIIVDALGPPVFLGEAATKGTFGKEIAKYLNKDERLGWTYDSHSEIQFWQGVNHSSKANEVFADEIKKQDQKFYSVLLDKSLNPEEQRYVNPDLLYYPTPDTIRNLVLIAGTGVASENARSAGRILLYLSKKLEWKTLLDEAEKVYPELKTTRTVLESLKSLRQDQGEYGYYPEIQEVSQDLALSIIESEPKDHRLTALASETLTNSSILEVLTKRDASQGNDAKTLVEADDFLKKLVEILIQNYLESDRPIPYSEASHLRGVFRDNLVGLVRLYESRPIDEMIASLKSLASLSREILNNQSKYSSLNYLLSRDVVDTMAKGKVDPELIFKFPEHAGALMHKEFQETRFFIFQHGDTILKDISDIRFSNRLVGEFGQKSDSLIRGYSECLEAGVVTTEEKELVLEFAKQFRVVAPATLAGYKEAKQEGFEKGYIAQLKSLAEKMTGSGTITEEERNKPYYKDLLKHVYSNNSGQWSSFESNDSCVDRSGDLAEFKINPRYEIDLLSQGEIRIKAGETPNPSVQDEVQKPILEIAKRMEELGHNKEKIQLMLKDDIDKTLKEIAEKGGLQGIDLGTLTSNEEKMFLILTDSIYGTRSTDPKRVKNLVTTYEFATFEDISDYMAGTRDRVSRANNQDYALLCEVGVFYSDRIKEVNRRLVEEAYKNPQIKALMPEYFRKLSQESTTTQKQDRINRLQVERLGASESFVKQLTRVLEKRRGRKYESEEVRKIIRRYEGLTGGLQEKASFSQNPQTRAFYGQLRSQRERTFEALEVITGEKTDPQKIHLGEINLKQALETETGIREGKYIEDQFASYSAQRFIDLFEDERVKIEGELAKFESISGKQREVLYGYITKSKESANARMVGGVCVAGDNPSRNKDNNMWDMPNYFQLVFQEPDTLQCQGLVLIHSFTEDGKRVLSASLNPSSTYAYSVDETALFNGIMGTLEQFVDDNGFDMITFSQNKTIRTNRTGGQFEKTMDAKIASVGKKFTFSSPQTFSYTPNYQLQDMDIAWERKP